MNLLIVITYTVAQLLAAIVATGHGQELTWYTPRIEYYLPKGAPAGVKGATNCWPPVYSGVAYINPDLPEDERLETAIHELIHLANNCHGAEHDVELATADVLAYLGERDTLLRFISRKAEGCYAPTLPEHIAMEYYCVPLWEIARGDLAEYPYLLEVLQEIGVR